MHNKIKDLCKKAGISIAKALHDCDIPESTYFSAVYRDKPLSFKTMTKLADYFNVSLDYFRE